MKEDGVWRTICGRRVFIKGGQSLTDAVRESVKFIRTSIIGNNIENLKSNNDK